MAVIGTGEKDSRPPRGDNSTSRASTPRCLLFSTHDVRFVARAADRVLVLGEGRLLADCRPDELLADDKLLAAARLRRPRQEGEH